MIYILIILVTVWDIYWKFQSLWIASKYGEKGWFFLILIFNTAGLLPIYYLYKKGYEVPVRACGTPLGSRPARCTLSKLDFSWRLEDIYQSHQP